jgi:hypothetical protein
VALLLEGGGQPVTVRHLSVPSSPGVTTMTPRTGRM